MPLEDVPGVDVVRYGAFGAAATSAFAAARRQQILVLVDGLPMAGGQIDDVNLGQFPVSGIDRIEVVEGGGSTLYGSGSIGGVINIITARSRNAAPRRSRPDRSTNRTISFKRRMSRFSAPTPRTTTRSRTRSNRQNAQAGLTGVTARYSHPIGAVRSVVERRTSSTRSPACLASWDFFSPTSEQGNVNRNVRVEPRTYGRAILNVARARRLVAGSLLHVQHAGRFELSELALSHAVASDDRESAVRAGALRSALDGEPAQRRRHAARTARLRRRPDARRCAHRPGYRRRLAAGRRQRTDLRRVRADRGIRAVAVVRRERRSKSTPACAANATAAWAARIRRRSAAFCRSHARCSSNSTPRPRFARRPPKNSTIPASRIRIWLRSERASPTRRSSRRRSGAAFRFGWFTTSGSNLIVSPPPLFIPENVGHASIAGLSLAVATPSVRRLRRDARRHEPLPRARPRHG